MRLAFFLFLSIFVVKSLVDPALIHKCEAGFLFLFVMEALMNLSQLLVCHVSINLGGCDRRMAQERLDGTDIGAIAQKIGGIAVTEGMR